MGTVWAFGVFGGTYRISQKTGSPEPGNRDSDKRESLQPSGRAA